MGQSGNVQFALTGASYDTEIGFVTSGDWGEDINAQEYESVGGVGTIEPGEQYRVVNLNWLPVDVNCLIDKMLRASYPAGALPEVTLHVGDHARGQQSDAWLCNTFEVSWEHGGALALAGQFLCPEKPTDTAGGGTHAPAKTIFQNTRGHVKLDAANADIKSFKLAGNNNVLPDFSLNAKTTDAEVFPEGHTLGGEKIDLDVEFYTDPDYDLSTKDSVTATSVILTALNNAGTPNTITVTVTTPKVMSWQGRIVGQNERQVVAVKYRLDPNSGQLAMTVA